MALGPLTPNRRRQHQRLLEEQAKLVRRDRQEEFSAEREEQAELVVVAVPAAEVPAEAVAAVEQPHPVRAATMASREHRVRRDLNPMVRMAPMEPMDPMVRMARRAERAAKVAREHVMEQEAAEEQEELLLSLHQQEFPSRLCWYPLPFGPNRS